MGVQLRVPSTLYRQAWSDLQRDHPIAHERVGFFFAEWAHVGGDLQIFPVSYAPVDDHHYIDAPPAGATINSDAIRAALQTSLTTGRGVWHVHLHPDWLPDFSGLDLDEQDKLMRSFADLTPAAPHGALVFTRNSCIARVWLPRRGGIVMADEVNIVGWPMRKFEWTP